MRRAIRGTSKPGSWLWTPALFDRLPATRTLAGALQSACEVVVGDPYAGLSDSELAARFDGGEGEALNALCRGHYSPVFRLAYTLTQNVPEAEDCTQETFARFIRSWPRWHDRSRGAGPWLTTIMKNVVVDRWQKEFRLTTVHKSALMDLTGGSGADHSPDGRLIEREFLTGVEEALRGVEPPCGACPSWPGCLAASE